MKYIMNILLSSKIFSILAIVILLIAALQKNNNFFNIRDILKKHFDIFGDNILAIITFFVVPLLLAIGIAKEKIVTKEILDIVSLIITIFLSFFFALMGVLTANDKEEKKKTVVNETFNTVVFECTLSIILLLIIFIMIFCGSYEWNIYTFMMSLIIYYLFFTITINIFIIIKRISRIFR